MCLLAFCKMYSSLCLPALLFDFHCLKQCFLLFYDLGFPTPSCFNDNKAFVSAFHYLYCFGWFQENKKEVTILLQIYIIYVVYYIYICIYVCINLYICKYLYIYTYVYNWYISDNIKSHPPFIWEVFNLKFRPLKPQQSFCYIYSLLSWLLSWL